jgi:hypothetical protein
MLEKKEKVNFIITCFNRGDYWEYLKQILNNYKLIDANYILSYNGESPDPDGIYVGPNRGHSLGEYDCIIKGYDSLESDSHRWIKLSVDSWLLNEEKILNIFHNMEKTQSGYAGYFWNEPNRDISTDIFFVDNRFGNIFEIMKEKEFPFFEHNKYLEQGVYHLLNENDVKIYLIEERNPIHWENREICEKLNWTMSHNLNENIEYVEKIFNKDFFNNLKN